MAYDTGSVSPHQAAVPPPYHLFWDIFIAHALPRFQPLHHGCLVNDTHQAGKVWIEIVVTGLVVVGLIA